MKTIRFKPECRQWIKDGSKTTTFRKTRRNGIYEIVEGGWYHPKHVGIYVRLTPIAKYDYSQVFTTHYHTEGPFDCPSQFEEWLEKVGLLDTLPSRGWLIQVQYLGENLESSEG